MRQASLYALGLAVLLAAAPARAQDCSTAPRVTVRDLNAIPQANLDFLMSRGANVTPAEIRTNLTFNLENQLVKVTAVVLTDWRNSGVRTPTGGVPGSLHVFVRDTSAASQGMEGMTIQLQDDRGAGVEINQFFPGDVIDVCGASIPFRGGGASPQVNQQFVPESITLAPVDPVPAGDPLRQPVLITTDDIHRIVPGAPAGQGTQVRWTEFSDYIGQYVRFDDIQLVQGVVGSNNRVNMLFQSVGQQTFMFSYDLSLRFRNDRCDDPAPATCYANPPYFTRPPEDPFLPPASGTVDLRGFLVFNAFDSFAVTTPLGAGFSITPIVDEDFVLVEGPPVVGAPSTPDFVVGNEPYTVEVTVLPGGGTRTITSVVVNYTFSTGGGGSVNLANTSGDVWSGDIPAGPDGAFVTYSATATDNLGETTTTASVSYRVLYGGITAIEHVQRTRDGLPGNSPFTGITDDVNLDAVVQQSFFDDGGVRHLILQDDPAFGDWTGVWAVVDAGNPVTEGDRILITRMTVAENFNVTELQAMTFTVTSGGAPLGYKVLPTGVLNGDDPGVQEAHEGMLLRFNNVTITDVNADGPDEPGGTPNFGEWEFSSDGTEANDIRADDLSEFFAPTYAQETFEIGSTVQYIQGAWYFSFSNWKLIPIDPADVGPVTTANEPGAPPSSYALHAAYPNPFNPSTALRYEVGVAGPVRLAVFDATGREVAVLVNGTVAAGTHAVRLDARTLASGVYLVRLQAGGQVRTQTVTLLK